MSLKKDYLITPEDVQNWQHLHEVLNKQANAIKELQERVKAVERVAGIGVDAEASDQPDTPPEPEREDEEDAPTHTGTPAESSTSDPRPGS